MAVDAKNPVIPTTASLAEAKGVYSRDCALCHGDSGNGKSDLATSMQLTMGELFNMIRVGDSKMPGEDAGRAKDAVVWNLIDYIRSFSKAPGATPEASASKPATPTSK
jgi:mono/diheme cytochrome c family protein